MHSTAARGAVAPYTRSTRMAAQRGRVTSCSPGRRASRRRACAALRVVLWLACECRAVLRDARGEAAGRARGMAYAFLHASCTVRVGKVVRPLLSGGLRFQGRPQPRRRVQLETQGNVACNLEWLTTVGKQTSNYTHCKLAAFSFRHKAILFIFIRNFGGYQTCVGIKKSRAVNKVSITS